MSKFTVHNNIIINTRTGIAEGVNDNNNKFFGVVTMCGHCDKGHFIPIFYSLSCQDKSSAITMAKNLGGVLFNIPKCILALGEISELEYVLLNYFNEHDQYLKGIASYDHISKRQIVMPDNINYQPPKEFEKYEKKIPAYLVKTADKYGEKWPLQRLFAPKRAGKKLIYPKHIDFRTILDNYLYQMVKLYGIHLKKATPLAYYYQIYGINNPLKIKYDNGKFSFIDNYTILSEVEVTDIMKPFLDKAHTQFLLESENETPSNSTQSQTTIKSPSSIDKFNKKFKKYQDIINKNVPNK